MSPHTVIARRKGAEGSKLGAEYVLLDPDGRMLRGLNPSAARIWELLDGSRTLAQIASELAHEHDAEESQILGDVLRFAGALEEKGLVDVVVPGSR